jgi:predicted dehydrogenase
MREIIGMPQGVAGACLTFPGIFCVLFQYDDFPVTYECGLSEVPDFDAHIEVYSPSKIVRVDYESPYIKGLPVTLTIRENVGEGGFQERKIRKTYQDPYTLELLELYDCAVNGTTPKTSAADARNDIELFRMILRAGASRYVIKQQVAEGDAV